MSLSVLWSFCFLLIRFFSPGRFPLNIGLQTNSVDIVVVAMLPEFFFFFLVHFLSSFINHGSFMIDD